MTRLLLRDLTPGTNYKIQLRAVEGDSVSEWSRRFDLSTTSDTVAPDVPNWITSDAWVVSGDTFVATWEPLDLQLEQNKDLSHFEIELSDGTTSAVIRTSNTSYTLTFDQNRIFFGTPRATVLARIRSVDAVGNVSAWNEQKSATNPPPPPVDFVTATSLYDAIDVKWEDDNLPDDFQAFVVQLSTTSASTGFTTVYVGAGSQYQHATTMFLTDHWFRVFVRDKFGTMSTSVVSGAVRPKSSFQTDDVPPAVPTGLAASIANNPNGVGARGNLSWNQPTPVDDDLAGFRIRWRKVGDTAYSQTDMSYDDRTAIIELQAAYQNYEFQIRSYDWMGNFSAWTSTVTAISPDAGTPGQATGVTSVAGRTSIRYSWTPSSITNLKEYEVTFSTSPTFASGNVTFRTGTSPHLDIGGLDPATTYYARVRAVNVAGTAGPWSATHTKATLSQLTPGDIGAPTTGDLDSLDGRVDEVEGKVDESVKTYTVEYAVNSSETVAPSSGWSTATPTRTPGSFIWTRTVVTYNDNTTSITNPALLTGNTGAPGNDGSDGRGIASTAVAYQVGTSGTAEPTGAWSANPVVTTAPGQFLWTRTITTYTDATTTTAYSVAAHGAKGADGSDGSDGRGIASTTVNYAKSTNGTVAPSTGWGTSIPATTTGEFLWTRTLITYTDTTTDTAYSVAAHGAKGGDGADGSDGSDGRGISSTAVTYQVGSSGTSEPTGTWLTTVPATAPGEFLWTRTITTYTDSTTTTAYSVSAHGEAGSDGNDGIGISTSTITYQASASGTVAPTGTWTTAIPSVPAGQFLWTRTILTYTDNTTSPPVYAVAGFGANGSDGQDGTDGADGNDGVSVTALIRYWLRQTAGAGTPATPGNVASPGGSWVTTEPDYLAGTELWMMDRISYSNGTYAYTTPAKSSSYTAAVTAITAANGKNKIVFSGSDATGTDYTDGDIWYKKSGTDIVAIWEFISGAWQPRTLRDEVLKSLSVGKLSSGTIDTASITLASSGVIQSADYSATLGWKLDSTGLVINKGQVKASTLIGDTLGSSTGTINIAAGANIQLNGGYIKSNTNAGTTMATAEASGAGFYLGNDGLFIGTGGKVKANALVSDTLTSTTITLGTGGEIKAAEWTINSSGITIPNGAINVAAVNIGATEANGIINKATVIDGNKITTGSIQSSDNAVDADGNPIPGVKAWMIDLAGNAVLGDVLVRGSMIMGVEDESQTSVLKSYGYVEGQRGWAITSEDEGFAEFNNVTVRGEVTGSSITGSTMTGGLIRGTQIVSVDNATLNITHKQRTFGFALLFFSEPHGRAIGDRIRVSLDQTVAVDTSFDTPGDTFATITGVGEAPGDYWISYSNSGPDVAKTAHGGESTVYVEGRSVVMSSSGLRLVSNDGQTNIIDLPTSPGTPAHFAGSIETDSISIEDHLVLNGTDNMMSMGSMLTLNSKVTPPGRPTVTYTWDATPIETDGFGLTMTESSFGFQYDGTRFVSSSSFDRDVVITNMDGTQQKLVMDAIEYEYGNDTWGAVYVGGKYYRLARKLVTSNYYSWHIVKHSSTGAVEATYLYDRKSTMGGTALQWGSVWGDVSGNFGPPIIGTDGTSIYIARPAGSDRKAWVAKYNTSGVFQSEKKTELVIPTRSGGRFYDLVSLLVGSFDFSGPRYIISVSWGTHNKNHSIRQSDGARMPEEDWSPPEDAHFRGIGWKDGAFYSLTRGREIHQHTSLAKTGSTTATVASTWLNASTGRETPMGTSANTTMVRRSKMVVSAGKLPPSVLGEGPDRARFYIGSFGTPAWGGRQDNPTASTTQSFTNLGTHTPITTWTTGTDFDDGAPASIRSNNGLMEITSDGRAIFGASDDVSTSSGNRPAMILGDPMANHLRMDGDEIVSMSNDSTQGTLYLNDGGETYSSRMVLTSTTDANTNAGNKPALRIGNINGSHLRIDDNEIISMSSNTTQSNLLLNPGGNVNFGNGTVAGSGGGFTVGTQLDVPNMTGGTGPNVTYNNGNGRLRVVGSAKRFKDNIEDWVIDPDEILALDPKEYDRNDYEPDETTRTHEIGFIADEAHELGLTDFVFYDVGGEVFSFDYSRWTVALQVVARAQREEINTLKEENAKMKADLEAIKDHLRL